MLRTAPGRPPPGGQSPERFGEWGAGWWAAPHPRPFPHKLRGGRVTRAERAECFGDGCASDRPQRDRILPSPAQRGRGRGRGPRRASVRCDSPSPDPAVALLSPLQFGGERPGEGGAASGAVGCRSTSQDPPGSVLPSLATRVSHGVTLTPSHPHTLTPSHPHTLTPSHPHTLTPVYIDAPHALRYVLPRAKHHHPHRNQRSAWASSPSC